VKLSKKQIKMFFFEANLFFKFFIGLVFICELLVVESVAWRLGKLVFFVMYFAVKIGYVCRTLSRIVFGLFLTATKSVFFVFVVLLFAYSCYSK
jgi:hypothetical protein